MSSIIWESSLIPNFGIFDYPFLIISHILQTFFRKVTFCTFIKLFVFYGNSPDDWDET